MRSESQEEALRVAQQHFARHSGQKKAHARQKDESQASFDRDSQVNGIRACNDRVRASRTARSAFTKTRELASRHCDDREIQPTNGTPRRQSSTGIDSTTHRVLNDGTLNPWGDL